ncbi:MAG: hypothetical protein R3C53_08615 [Pirellulaceae bacterium]
MLPLDDPGWSQLRHAYGSGSDIPAWIQEVESRLQNKRASDENLLLEIGDNLCHQWGTYDGTYAAIPHLVQLCTKAPSHDEIRIRLLEMIGWCVACLRLNRTEARGDLIRWFEESVLIARDLIAESLPFVSDSLESQAKLRNLLAAFATCHGNAPLGLLLFELDEGGFRCDNCQAFIRPMQSSMNAFWVERRSN